MQIYQKTLAREVVFSGVGLHSGKKVNVRISPATANTGIVFVRTDIPDNPSLKASPEHFSKLYYATNLCNGNCCINTVEHLMAALSSFGIDNAYIYANAEELPILDGSSAPYMYLFEEAGVKTLNKKRKYAKLTKKIEVEHKGKYIHAEPYDMLFIENIISFDHTYQKVRFQKITYEHSLENFRKISVARTFCFENEVEWFRSQGLAKGGSLDNAIVIGEHDILNSSGLRIENEFVAHKTIDLIGDIYILGYPLLAKIKAFKTGHFLNALFVNKIYSEDAFEITELECEKQEGNECMERATGFEPATLSLEG